VREKNYFSHDLEDYYDNQFFLNSKSVVLMSIN